ncbi:MAG: Gfo/Idh/MocA family oxidoreductase, partial [Terrimicrobiaceae bacterium]|nr:Gfo/Idh/MocA family oxidoreductase [Terrimicrobiaceae bacterium]
EIGDVIHVEASYLQAWLASMVWGDWRKNPAWLWRLSSKHGSRGVLGDVGVHILDYASFPAGPVKEVFCRLKTYPKAPGNRIGEYTLDANDSAVMTVEFANGAAGVIHTTRWAAGYKNRLALLISGTKGSIRMDSDKGTDRIEICSGRGLDTAQWREVACKPVPTNYEIFIRAILRGTPFTPDFARGLEIQEILEACFTSHTTNRPVKLPAAQRAASIARRAR